MLEPGGRGCDAWGALGSPNHSVRFMGSGWWHSTLMGSGGKPHHVPAALPALGSRSGWAPRSDLFIYPRNSSGRAQACAVRLWWGRNIPETRPTSPALQPDHRHPAAVPACPGCPGAHGRRAVVPMEAARGHRALPSSVARDLGDAWDPFGLITGVCARWARRGGGRAPRSPRR